MTKSEEINQILHQHIRLVFRDAVNYKELIQAFIERDEKQLLLHNVSQQRELLVWLQKSDLVTFPKDEINEVIDDYIFYQTNCG